MRRLGRWLVAGVVLLAGRGRNHAEPKRQRIVAAGEPDPRAELVVVALLALAGMCALGFLAVYVVDPPARTQLLGSTIGLCFALLAAAAVVAGRKLVAQDEDEEPYPEEHDEDQAAVVQVVEESGERITRRRLLTLTAGGAGTAIVAALAAPAFSLGPFGDVSPLHRTPWGRGVRLVDGEGRPVAAEEIEPGTFYTAYPEGADRARIGAPLVLVRLEPDELSLPAARAGWAPGGIVAYSKICTHAGCAVAMYRTPRFEPTAPGPALVCPCHYSAFDPGDAGRVLFGPAARPLPQLPLELGAGGVLVAGGELSGPVGPSWWGVRME